MKKETLLEIILGTVGGLIFAVGMCMCLLPEWNLMVPGVIASIVGFIVLLCIIPIYKKNRPKKAPKKTDWGMVATFIIGVVGSLLMGFGMSRIMVGEPTQGDFILGIAVGVVGLLVCVLNYPVYAYLKSK